MNDSAITRRSNFPSAYSILAETLHLPRSYSVASALPDSARPHCVQFSSRNTGDGLALAYSDVPVELVKQLRLRVHERGGEMEVRFMRRAKEPLLPVWYCGQLRLVPWGSRTGRLPKSGVTWQRTIDEGGWEPYEAEPVEIRASLGHDGGVWYRIRQGIRGLLVETPQETAAYLIVEPASHYYKVMTRRERMPVLIGERI
jgi:hypothetical protein